MDPEACLKRAQEAAYIEDRDEVLDALLDYLEWRRKGGFQPPDGDLRAFALALEYV